MTNEGNEGNEGNDSTNNGAITPSVSLEALMQAVSNISAARTTDAPELDDLYESSQGGGYTKWRMPPNTRSALVTTMVQAGSTPAIAWSEPGDYRKTQKVYRMVGDQPEEVKPTDIFGVLVGCETRLSRKGNHGEPTASYVVGVCKDGKCIKRLPSLETGIVGGSPYEYSDREDSKNTLPSKNLVSMRWKPVVMPEAMLLEDLIRTGRSTAQILTEEGKEVTAVYENRGMAYMWVTHVGVSINIQSDEEGNPKLTKLQQPRKEQILANLVTTKRRVDKKVVTSYTSMEVVDMNELLDENGEPIGPTFLALNMSQGGMRSYYLGGLASIDRYVNPIMGNKTGLRPPANRTLSEDEVKLLRTINDTGFYKQVSSWTTWLRLGMKEVKGGTFYSMPDWTGISILGEPPNVGKEYDDWGDKSGINGLNVHYLSPALAARLKYDPSTSTALGKWEKALQEAGFDSTPEEFTLASLAPKGGDTDYTDVSFTPISSPRPGYAGKVAVSDSEYFAEEVTYDEVEADDPFA